MILMMTINPIKLLVAFMIPLDSDPYSHTKLLSCSSHLHIYVNSGLIYEIRDEKNGHTAVET
jgi:hypothetical protein